MHSKNEPRPTQAFFGGTLSKFTATMVFALALVALSARADRKADIKPMSVVIKDTRVTVSGVTPHGKVVFFGIGRFVHGYRVTVRRFDETRLDDDGDGVVDLDIKEKVPWKTVFAAIDFTSGRFAMATPEGFPLLPMTLSEDPVAGERGVLDRIVVLHRFCDVLLVRPGVGAWGQILADGNKSDEDRLSNSRAMLKISRAVAIADDLPPAPSTIEPGDVVVLIDSQKMESYAVEVGAR